MNKIYSQIARNKKQINMKNHISTFKNRKLKN